ncbi:MAG: RagB/SusD family nutrient uptake outer membrane protein [Bacteroidota bacterium]
MLASATDEARAKSGWVLVNTIVKGAMSPTNDGAGLGLWKIAYESIRKANEIIQGVEGSSVLEEADKNMVLAQARYVRAFQYYELARRYGDVPLITEVQSIDDDILVSKTARSAVYDFINAELNAVALILPNKSEAEAGAVNKQAAIAINSRVMLYAEEWQKAADLADKLITGPDNDGIALHPDYQELFRSYSGNNEVIMEKLTSVPNAGHSFAYFNGPVRWRTDWGGQTDPTQQFVDSYEMAETGLPITDGASGYNPDRPYDGRDLRFYASIFYHGSEYSEVQPSFGEPFIDMEWNNFNEGPGDKPHGAASITGYLIKKFINPADGFATKAHQSVSSYKEIRFAEVLLNYAEGANEASGPSQKVYDAINLVRARAGLPDLPAGLSKDDMRDAIRQERKIELAFENHRWFDLIRWGIAEEVLDGFEPRGVKITRNASAPSQDAVPQLFDQDMLDFDTSYIVLGGGRNQSFPASHNLVPIPQDDIDKNPNLEQNPGY